MGAQLNVYGIVPESIVDGPGLRYAVFVQGCSHGCPGCQNPESHAVDGGTRWDVDDIFADLRENRLVRRVTFSGGEPFEQAPALAQLAWQVKAAGYDLWVWTGYLYEDLRARAAEAEAEAGADATSEAAEAAAIRDLLVAADVLVDGPYVQALRSLDLAWRGSANQRIINLAAMRAAGDLSTIILWEPASQVSPELLRKPESW